MSIRMTEDQVLAHQEKMQGFRGQKSTPEQETPDDGLESKLQRRCEEHLEDLHWPYIHDRSRGRNRKGILDLIVFAPAGKVFIVELKADCGRPTDEQKIEALKLMALGHDVYLGVRSFKRFVQICLKYQVKEIMK